MQKNEQPVPLYLLCSPIVISVYLALPKTPKKGGHKMLEFDPGAHKGSFVLLQNGEQLHQRAWHFSLIPSVLVNQIHNPVQEAT